MSSLDFRTHYTVPERIHDLPPAGFGAGGGNSTSTFANGGTIRIELPYSEISELVDVENTTSNTFPVWDGTANQGFWTNTQQGQILFGTPITAVPTAAAIGSYLQWTGIDFPNTGTYEFRTGCRLVSSGVGGLFNGIWDVKIDGVTVVTFDFSAQGAVTDANVTIVIPLGTVNAGAHSLRLELAAMGSMGGGYSIQLLTEQPYLVQT